MTFVANLKAIMRERGVNQSELGRRLGITSQAVNQWLKASEGTMPKGTRIEDVADALGVSPQALFTSTAGRLPPQRRSATKRSPHDGAIPDSKRRGKFGDQPVDLRFEAVWSRLDLAAKSAVLAVAVEIQRGRKAGAA